MLNITIRGHDLSEVQTIEDLAEKTKEQGIHTLQLALGLSFPEIPSGANEINSGMGNYVKRVLEKQEVTVGILSCYINMIHPDLTLLRKLDVFCRKSNIRKKISQMKHLLKLCPLSVAW